MNARPSTQRAVLAATILASSMTFIDATVVNVALPALEADLHATLTEVQWVIEAYALLLGGLILVGGSMGDQFGRRRVFFSGVLFFMAASVFCGVATTVSVLIAGRALQGIGAAFLVPGSLAIISATFAEADRGRAIGTWSGASAMTSAIGPVAGGWLIEHVSWRAVFFLNVPLALVVLALTWLFMDESRDPSRTAATDWAGATLAVIGLGGVVFGLLEWPPLGGGDPLVLVSLTAGTVSLILFVLTERNAASPMMPLDLFTSRTFTLANVLTLFLYAAVAVIFFLVPMNLIQVQGYTATAAGAALLPLPLILFALSRWSGGLVARVGSRLPLTIGPAVAACGVALYARPGIGGSYWTTFFPAIVVLAVGLAVTVAPLTTTVMGAVERQHAGVASGVNNAVARVAGLLAIAVFGVVLGQSFDTRARPALDALHLSPSVRAAVEQQLPRMAGADLAAIASIGGAERTAAHAAITGAFVGSFRLVMLIAAALALAAAVGGAFLQRDGSVSSPEGGETVKPGR